MKVQENEDGERVKIHAYFFLLANYLSLMP